MAFRDCMLPRDHRAAARSVSVLAAVAAGVSLLFMPLQPADRAAGPTATLVSGGVIVVVIVLAVLARYFREANRLAWTLGPLAAVAAIAVVDLLTEDSSVSAQIFLVFPVLYGASQLRVAGSVVLTTTALLAEVVVVATQLPGREALVDAGYVTAALVTTAVLLGSATERQARLVARLEEMAAIDPLTGLVTRRVLDQAASSALSGANSDEGTSLILLDVDNFKTINDGLGHPAGDQVLVELAELMKQHARGSDVVCRLGGDEIAVLLPACSREVAFRRAATVLDDIRSHPFVIEATGDPLSVSVSLGLAHAPTDAYDLRTLYSAADAALYEAKRSGRGRLVVAADVARGARDETRDETRGAA
jgi:diguanylate cyclase (GGDEF)-like protein